MTKKAYCYKKRQKCGVKGMSTKSNPYLIIDLEEHRSNSTNAMKEQLST